MSPSLSLGMSFFIRAHGLHKPAGNSPPLWDFTIPSLLVFLFHQSRSYSLLENEHSNSHLYLTSHICGNGHQYHIL